MSQECMYSDRELYEEYRTREHQDLHMYLLLRDANQKDVRLDKKQKKKENIDCFVLP